MASFQPSIELRTFKRLLNSSRSNIPSLSLRTHLGAVISSTLSTSLTTETETSLPSSQVQLVEESCSSTNISKDWRSKGSSQLTRWARTRKLRSGRSSAPPLEPKEQPSQLDLPSHYQETLPIKRQSAASADVEANDGMVSAFLGRENAVYMVSDGTGWTAEHSVHAALGQFEHCLMDHGCPVSTHLFSEVPSCCCMGKCPMNCGVRTSMHFDHSGRRGQACSLLYCSQLGRGVCTCELRNVFK